MCLLQRPWPSPPADAGIRLLCSVPVTSGRTGAAGGGKFENLKKNFIFFQTNFTYILSLVLCPVPCLHFVCSFCLETEKSPWRPKSVHLGQKWF
ncbi:unnamed protein product [Staurois parvus]|uniref:Uncharacterized protein n=1 Tax=Staurois parvus TaxID=386267 RepID=A0ABN9H2U4_9NEOB|nr:unnamed protein product [Staurois parvus]